MYGKIETCLSSLNPPKLCPGSPVAPVTRIASAVRHHSTPENVHCLHMDASSSAKAKLRLCAKLDLTNQGARIQHSPRDPSIRLLCISLQAGLCCLIHMVSALLHIASAASLFKGLCYAYESLLAGFPGLMAMAPLLGLGLWWPCGMQSKFHAIRGRHDANKSQWAHSSGIIWLDEKPGTRKWPLLHYSFRSSPINMEWLDQMHGMQTCISKIMDHLICPDPLFLHRCLRRCTAQSSQLQKLPEDIPSLSTCTGCKDVLVAQTTSSPCFLSCPSFPTATQRGGALALGGVSL